MNKARKDGKNNGKVLGFQSMTSSQEMMPLRSEMNILFILEISNRPRLKIEFKSPFFSIECQPLGIRKKGTNLLFLEESCRPLVFLLRRLVDSLFEGGLLEQSKTKSPYPLEACRIIGLPCWANQLGFYSFIGCILMFKSSQVGP